MANELSEVTGPVDPEGRDVHVINKRLPAEIGFGSLLFEIVLWLLAIIPGLVFLFMKVFAHKYLRQLQQKIQHNASQIDNYIEQRVRILDNAVRIVERAIDLDRDVMKSVAELRGGVQPNEETRSEIAGQLDMAMRSIHVAVEAYPELKAHHALADALQQNNYLQKEITAARDFYNDTVYRWNADIFAWPTKMIVAARAGYTTRIPFTAHQAIKDRAKETFF